MVKTTDRFFCLCCGLVLAVLLQTGYQTTQNLLKKEVAIYNAPDVVRRAQENTTFDFIDDDLENENENEKERTEKPLLVLHVGPTKTGTTSIQLKLESQKYEDTIKSDNYTVVHFNYLDFEKLLKECFKKGKDCNESGSWRRLMGLYNQSTTTTNAIHSCETFSLIENNQEAISRFRTLLDHYRIKVILTYRPAHEWLVSAYHQAEKGKFFKARGGKYLDFPKQPTRKTFREYFANTFHQMKDSYHTQNLYKAIFGADAVTVMQIPADGSLLPEFFCNTLPYGNNTCVRFLEQGNKGSRRANRSGGFLFDHDLLLEHARQHLSEELKNNTNQRRNATKLLEQRLFQSSLGIQDMPQECLTVDEQQALWDYSWMVEQAMAPHPRTRDAFQESFVQSTSKFCSVDVNATLQNTTWREIIISSLA